MDAAQFAEFYKRNRADLKAQDYFVNETVFENQLITLVHKDAGDEPRIAVATCWRVENGDTPPSVHHVIAAHDGVQLYLECDDNGVNGSRDPAAQEEARTKALANLAAHLSAAGALPPGAELAPDALAAIDEKVRTTEGVTEKDSPCWFWKNYEAKGQQEGCKHVHAAVRDYKGKDKLFADMAEAFADKMQELGVRVKEVEIESTEKPAFQSLEFLAFKVPVLFEGERGAGKTYEAREFAAKHGCKVVEVGGHEELTAVDLLGHYVQSPKGGMLWKDGPLTKAFRSAAAGEKTVLILDELLRIPQRQLSVLLTSLSPDRDGNYRLATGRMKDEVDGVGVEEEMRVPVKNLAVIGTTNVGQGYAVDEIDPALKERFIPIYRESTKEQLQAILKSHCKSHPSLKEAVAAAVTFFDKARKLHSQGQLADVPTVRTVVRAFQLSDNLTELVAALKGQAQLWCAREMNGAPLKEQVAAVEQLIDGTFSKALVKSVAKSGSDGRSQ